MTESIFTSQTPGSPNVVEAGGITTGTTFIPAVDGVVSAIRFYATTDVEGTYTGSLYLPTADDDPEGSGTGTLLGSGVLAGAATPGAWNVIPITPVNVTAGTAYRVAMHNSAGHYVSTGSFAEFVTGGLTSGNLFAPPAGYDIGIGTISQGSFNIGAAPAYPSNGFNSGCYFVDVVFTATADVAEGSAAVGLVLTLSTTGEAPALTPNEGSAALTIDYTISAVGITPDPETSSGLCGWDIDPESLGVCSDWADYPEETQEAALQLSYLFLWAATGRRYGICPITVRPSQSKCTPAQYQAYPVWPGQGSSDGYPMGPFLFGGQWFNSDCGSCCNSGGCSIVLRGPVAEVTEVLVDGETISSSAYRVDVSQGAYLLVRTDGLCWPSCQNMTASTSEDDTFSVTYGYGRAIPISLRIAAAMLACEYAKAITGGPCKLPARMTRLSRQGIDVEVEAVDAAAGTTGLKEVDDVVAALNPGRLKSPPVVLSLDLPEYGDRFTVWGA
jgi:hypothetical protein